MGLLEQAKRSVLSGAALRSPTEPYVSDHYKYEDVAKHLKNTGSYTGDSITWISGGSTTDYPTQGVSYTGALLSSIVRRGGANDRPS